MGIDWYRFGQPKLVGMCVGAIAGLATVTPRQADRPRIQNGSLICKVFDLEKEPHQFPVSQGFESYTLALRFCLVFFGL